MCKRQFTLNHVRPPISLQTVELVERLHSEQISHQGICRGLKVSRSWFRRHLEKYTKSVPYSIDPAGVVGLYRFCVDKVN